MQRVALQLRAHPGGRRGGRPGDVVRRAHRSRALRGPRGAEDVALPHPHEPREDARPARGAHGPFSSLAGEDDVDGPRSTPTASCRRAPSWPGHWASGPARWTACPRSGCSRRGAHADRRRDRHAARPPARGHRPARRRGWPPEEVCDVLGVSEGNQRVLLHRARSKVRARARALLRRRDRGPDRMTERPPLQELVELVTAYLEGALPAGERARFDAHLDRVPRLRGVRRPDPPHDRRGRARRARARARAPGHRPALRLSRLEAWAGHRSNRAPARRRGSRRVVLWTSWSSANTELAEVDTLLERGGEVLVVEGRAGIGKTSLVDAACRQAAERGHEILRARGSSFEADFAFGVVRQLLERRLAGAEARERAALLAGPAAAVRPLSCTP